MTDTDITVKPGQIWADNDPRSGSRTVRVVEIIRRHVGGNGGNHPRGVECAIVELVTGRGTGYDEAKPGRRTTIRLDRFRPTKSGYRLVQDVEGD